MVTSQRREEQVGDADDRVRLVKIRLDRFVVRILHEPVAEEWPQDQREQRKHERRVLHQQNARSALHQQRERAECQSDVALGAFARRNELDERQPKPFAQSRGAPMRKPGEKQRLTHGRCPRVSARDRTSAARTGSLLFFCLPLT